ncbi:MAG: glycosyltransferase family 2 protein [Candidatus Eremiobacteraeota bacterium]|nr:glycosyltransferase family 2 protein [Candidatus Eremiobacteraeota bacterium]
MNAYANWFFSFFDPYHIDSAFASVGSLFDGSSLVFWLLVYTLIRYTVPDVWMWVSYCLRPRAFRPPTLERYAGFEPLVSVVIAGRNPGQSLVASIRSVLNCDYKNVEIIFADDYSTDNTVALARTFERTGRVRVFANANHSGKPVNLNYALNFARGEFVFVLDSDTQIFPDTIGKMLPYFEDPRVGAVCPSIYVRNGTVSLITMCQRIEYMMTYTLNALWRDRLDLISIICGMGGMFRGSALRGLGGFDTGLGDDTDLTIRLRKARWKLRMSVKARISTDVPESLPRLMKQRSRWTRNMVKVRLRKHRDMGSFKYGFTNAFMFYENIVNRVVRPYLVVGLALNAHLIKGAATPVIIGGLYVFTTLALFIKVLIARDMTTEPPLRQLWLVPFYVFYRIPLVLVQVYQVTRELLQIKTWHPYVPRRIWNAIPHH